MIRLVTSVTAIPDGNFFVCFFSAGANILDADGNKVGR